MALAVVGGFEVSGRLVDDETQVHRQLVDAFRIEQVIVQIERRVAIACPSFLQQINPSTG